VLTLPGKTPHRGVDLGAESGTGSLGSAVKPFSEGDLYALVGCDDMAESELLAGESDGLGESGGDSPVWSKAFNSAMPSWLVARHAVICRSLLDFEQSDRGSWKLPRGLSRHVRKIVHVEANILGLTLALALTLILTQVLT
jgi:hypothetical protein